MLHLYRNISQGDQGGIVMVNFYPKFLRAEGNATIQDLIGKQKMQFSSPPNLNLFLPDHINHIRAVAGVNSVGLGSDFNGVPRQLPDLEDESKYPNLFAELLRQGDWTEEELGKLAWGNLVRVWNQVEVARDSLFAEAPHEKALPSDDRIDTKCTTVFE